MDDGGQRREPGPSREGRLEALAPGQAIVFGGDRVSYVTPELAAGLFRFGRDEDGAGAGAIAVNTLFNPVLLRYYERGFNQDR